MHSGCFRGRWGGNEMTEGPVVVVVIRGPGDVEPGTRTVWAQ